MYTNTKPMITGMLICLLILGSCSPAEQSQEASELARLEARAQNIEIIRDDFGVPHIYAKTDADAVFGLLYAQAEDDFKRIERNYVWAIGRLAEVEGEEALFSDLRARLYMTTDEAIAAFESAPDWLQDLCRSFADGLNYYLATHIEERPALLTRFEPWMPMFFFEGSIGGDIEQIPLDGMEAFYGEQREAPRSEELHDKDPGGSNGFAISGERTRSGNAMLLINPHTSFYFRGEAHVVSEEGLNAYGAVTWGQFFVYQGFSDKNGWMHTSTRADFKDEFIEDVFEQDGDLFYQYGDEARPVDVSSVTLKYRDGDTVSERTFPMYHTHHGPVTHMIDGQWVATKINWDPVQALEQSYTRTKTNGHDEFHQMMGIRTNSSNNTVYADAEGNIAYYHGNFMPRRDPAFDYSQPVDGSNPATDWQGLHEVDETVTLLNPPNGWLQNCNSTPFTAALEFSPRREDFPAYMAPDDENFRGIHAVRVLKGQDDFTLEKLIELAYDPYLPAFEVLIPGLVEAFDRSSEDHSTLESAVDVLRDWDYRVSAESVAMTLAFHYARQYDEHGEYPEDLGLIAFMEYLGRQSPDKDRLQIFADTLAGLEADFGSWQTPWGEINRFQRLDGSIDLAYDDTLPSLPIGMGPGWAGALASFGARHHQGTKRIYGSSGNSFVAVVEFGDRVRAMTLLAGGQSGDPGSPHFLDQSERYQNRQFKDVAYYREDVEQRAVRRYRPGQTD